MCVLDRDAERERWQAIGLAAVHIQRTACDSWRVDEFFRFGCDEFTGTNMQSAGVDGLGAEYKSVMPR